ANPLVYRDQHDVHHPNTADAQGQGPNEREQNFQPNRDSVDDGPELVAPEHLNRLLVRGRELLACGNGGEKLRHGPLLELRSAGLEDHYLRSLCVPQVAGRREWDPGGLVIAGEVVAQLNLAGHHAHDRKPHSADLHQFTHGRPAAEQLLFDTSAQETDTAALQLVGSVKPTAFARNFVPHLAILGAHTPNGRSPDHALTIADARAPHGFPANVLHQWSGGFNHLQIGLLEHHLFPGTLSARLFAGLLRPRHHNAASERVKAAHENVAEAGAVGDQERHSHDAPNDAGHGEGGTGPVAL